MPPVLDALQAIFPDLLQQPVSASDEPAPHTVSDTAQTPSVDVTQAYSGRITAINTKVYHETFCISHLFNSDCIS